MDDKKLFDDFKTYVSNNGYVIDEVGETSIIARKNRVRLFLFYTFSDDYYVLRLLDDYEKYKFNVIFNRMKNNYELKSQKHDYEEKKFLNIGDIIKYFNEKSYIKI